MLHTDRRTTSCRIIFIGALLILSLLKIGVSQTLAGFSVLQERNGLPAFFAKLGKGSPVTICYLGGSITEAAGYRVKTEQYFRKKYPKSSVSVYNAGVGGTGSSLGAFRLQEEVLSHHPDLVFVEFAVNDAASDSLLVCNAIEGIVRQIKKQDLKTDICFLYTIHDQMTGAYNKGELYRSVRFIERVADYYKLPSVNLGIDVLKEVNQGKLIFRGTKEDEAAGRAVFSFDGTHPGDLGHEIYTKTIVGAFENMKSGKEMKKLPQPLYSGNFGVTRMLSPDEVQRTAGWEQASWDGYLKPFQKAYPGLICTADTSDSVVVRFSGTYFGFCDIIGPSATPSVVVNIDGQPDIRTRFDSYGYFYRRSYCLIGPLKDGEHVVILKKGTMTTDKQKMVNYHETREDPADYRKDLFFLGKLMIIGKLL